MIPNFQNLQIIPAGKNFQKFFPVGQIFKILKVFQGNEFSKLFLQVRIFKILKVSQGKEFLKS